MPQLSLYLRIKTGLLKVQIDSPAEHRFWACVDKNGPTHPIYGRCWRWTRPTNHNGYGQFMVDYKVHRAHRYAYEILVGSIPERIQVLHKCDNPSCVRPDHLFLGTSLVNMRDKVSKNRQARGETIGTVKLTEEEIKEIRRRYATHRRNSSGPNSQASMAREFGVTQAAIPYVILHGWKHV